MNQKKIQILIVEDDLDFQFLIRQKLQREPDMAVMGCCETEAAAVELATSGHPDVVLMDLALQGPISQGIRASRTIRLKTDAKVLMLTSYEDYQTVVNAAAGGFAHGYLFKSQFEILTSFIRQTAAGKTPQQMMIYSLILSPLSSAEYAVFEQLMGKDICLQSSPKTIANQKTSLLKKLNLSSLKELRHIFKDF